MISQTAFPEKAEPIAAPAGRIGKNAIPYKNIGVPVLCYHGIVSDEMSEKLDDPYTLGLSEFKSQMQLIHDMGYTTITLKDLYEFVEGKKHFYPPQKPIVITFDDGWKSFYKNAVPVLNTHHFKGVVFIYPKATGYGGFLKWPDLEKIHAAGHEIEGHGYSHEFLNRMKPEDQLEEFVKIKKEVKKHLQKDVKWIAYPYGAFDENTVSMLKKTEYIGAFTVFEGENLPGQNPYYLNRYLVKRSDTLSDFKSKVTMKGLVIQEISPAPGSVIKKNDTIEISFKKKLDPAQISIYAGNYFLNPNKKIKFNYSEDTRTFSFKAPGKKKEFLLINVVAVENENYHISSILYQQNVSK